MKEKMDHLMELLKNVHPDFMEKTNIHIKELNNKRALAFFEKNIQRLDKNSKINIIKTLGSIGGKESVKLLLPLLGNEDSEIKKEVIHSLGKSGEKYAVKSLIGMLGEKNIKINVLQALGQLGHIKSLIQSLSDDDETIVASSLEILGRLHNKSAATYFLKSLKSSSPLVRARAAEALGKYRNSTYIIHFVKLLKDTDEDVRKEIVRALGKIEDEKAIPYLIKALKDKNWEVRRNAVEGLGNFQNKEAVNNLIKLLKDENPTVRNYAAESLGKTGDKKALKSLMEKLDDPETVVRGSAAKAIGLLGDSDGADRLKERLSKETDLWVRRYIEEALFHLEEKTIVQNKKTILIVDDDELVIGLLKLTLGEFYNIIEAYDGEEAVFRAKSEKPHLILLDIIMPKMDGIEVIQSLSIDKDTCSIPIIIVSGRSREKDYELIEKLGVADYIPKPFNVMKIKERMDIILDCNKEHFI